MHEVQRDAKVLRRYERHFKLSEPELRHYFAGLHVEPLEKGGRYVVYNIDNAMVVRSRLLHLPAGTLVFADASHKPILKFSCGNPMVSALPALGESGPDLDVLAGSPAGSRGAAGDPLSVDEPLLAEAPELPEAAPISTTGDTTPTDQTPPFGSGVPDVPIGPIGTGSNLDGDWFGLLPLAGIVGIITTTHGNTTSLPPVATPEPATFAPLVLGVTALALRRRKK